MNYKKDFIKRERSNDKKIPAAKEPYRGVSWTNSNDENTNGTTNNHKRKDEPFVLMFRNFIFFDVKSYECRNGDLYIRNIVDGVILKRYFRMNANDQLTVFKNRLEFIDLITSTWDGSSVTRDECPGAFDDVVRVLEKNPGSAQIFNRNDFM